ncbi:hypothetical protein [Microbacterium lushaniae]|uniref:Uncharacterized protein n=1 Tax=Microbacterium lushaniae TaxID=2614639 RepID=A0A5J6L1A7_9MICO|nr:hypothetical protein [Microbacterium lushaniae]QEW02268.1 hypothetical protein F6J85_03585 [Microbacterium lushaniae]
MSTTSGALMVSAAGLAEGHRAFQEFLLAGERYVVAGLARRGAEERFGDFYRNLPEPVRRNAEGYFKKQALLDRSQRVAVMGPYVQIGIAMPLNERTAAALPPVNSAVRSELAALRGEIVVAPGGVAAPPPPRARSVRHVDLVLQEFTVEKSNDDTWRTRATDTVHFAVTTLSEKGTVTTKLSKFGSRDEGEVVKVDDVRLASIELDRSSTEYPRTLSFKIDAVEKDDGNYNAVLQAAKEYVQAYVTEALIARGIIVGGMWVGIPIPPPLANYLASYVKGWFDSAVDWIVGLFDNPDDLIGTYTRTVTLADDELRAGIPFTHRFVGNDGRWKVGMAVMFR